MRLWGAKGFKSMGMWRMDGNPWWALSETWEGMGANKVRRISVHDYICIVNALKDCMYYHRRRMFGDYPSSGACVGKETDESVGW